MDKVESIHAYFRDRVDGGSGYEILWKEWVEMADLKNLIKV